MVTDEDRCIVYCYSGLVLLMTFFWVYDQTVAAIVVTVMVGLGILCCIWAFFLPDVEIPLNPNFTELSEQEWWEILDDLSGVWKITPGYKEIKSFNEARVTSKNIQYFSPDGDTKEDVVYFSRGPEGELNLDWYGKTIIKEWDKEKQEMIVFGFFRLKEYENVKIKTTWRRPDGHSANDDVAYDDAIELIPTTAQKASPPSYQTASAPQPGEQEAEEHDIGPPPNYVAPPAFEEIY